MNPEQLSYRNADDQAPQHRGEQQPKTSDPAADSATDAYVAHVVAHAPTPETGQAVSELYARHGAAFAMHLALDGADTRLCNHDPDHPPTEASTMASDFESNYHGHYLDRDALIRDTIESFGWQRDLDRLLAGHPDLSAVVTLDRDAIYAQAYDHYEIMHAPDGFHVFERWP